MHIQQYPIDLMSTAQQEPLTSDTRFDTTYLQQKLTELFVIRDQLISLNIQGELAITAKDQVDTESSELQREHNRIITEIIDLNISIIEMASRKKWQKFPQAIKDLVDQQEAIAIGGEACYLATLSYNPTKGAWSTYLVACINQLIYRKLYVPYVPIVVPEWQKHWREITPTLISLDAPPPNLDGRDEPYAEFLGKTDELKHQARSLRAIGQLLYDMFSKLEPDINLDELSDKRWPFLLEYFYDEDLTTEEITHRLKHAGLGPKHSPYTMTSQNTRLNLRKIAQEIIKPRLIAILSDEFPSVADAINQLNQPNQLRSITVFLISLLQEPEY